MKSIMKYIAVFVVLAAIASCSDDPEMQYSVDPSKSPSSVVTGTPTNITYSSVDLHGTHPLNENVVSRGFFLSLDSDFTNPTITSSLDDSFNSSDFVVTISALSELTTYYVKAYAASFAGGTTFGDVMSFTTLEAPPQWEDLVGTWTVTEDLYMGGGWYNGETYDITISGVAGDKFTIKIDGVLPYFYPQGHTLYATVDNMVLTLKSQELLPGWDEPDYRTYIAALLDGTIANNNGQDFPPTSIDTNADDKLEIRLLGGLGTYSYLVYDLLTSDNSYAGYWVYLRNTVWVKQ